jgi:hypothetical protein
MWLSLLFLSCSLFVVEGFSLFAFFALALFCELDGVSEKLSELGDSSF